MDMTGEESETADIATRLRRVLTSAALDCECRSEIDGVLERFTAIERRHEVRRILARARSRRDGISARIAYLMELDQLGERERDLSVFGELAQIFDDIAEEATEAAGDLRRLRAMGPTDH